MSIDRSRPCDPREGVMVMAANQSEIEVGQKD